MRQGGTPSVRTCVRRSVGHPPTPWVNCLELIYSNHYPKPGYPAKGILVGRHATVQLYLYSISADANEAIPPNRRT